MPLRNPIDQPHLSINFLGRNNQVIWREKNRIPLPDAFSSGIYLRLAKNDLMRVDRMSPLKILTRGTRWDVLHATTILIVLHMCFRRFPRQCSSTSRRGGPPDHELIDLNLSFSLARPKFIEYVPRGHPVMRRRQTRDAGIREGQARISSLRITRVEHDERR